MAQLKKLEKNYKLYGILIHSSNNDSTGNKIHNTFKQLLGDQGYGYEKAILIPMDLPFITEEDLVSTFAKLDTYRFVMGPEINGGIYLIGINKPYPYTLEEVGNIFNITRERVRQIEAKALRKLRHPIRAKFLKGFLEQQ